MPGSSVRLRSALLICFPLTLLTVVGAPTGNAGEPAPPAHTDTACTECHLSSRSRPAPDADMGQVDLSCRTCHIVQETRPPGAAHAFHDDPQRGCLECHSFHSVRSIRATGHRLSLEFGHASLQAICISCHLPGGETPSRQGGHEAATEFFHSGAPELLTLTPSEACLLCHSSDSPQTSSAPPASDAPRFKTHASHPFGVTVVPGREWSAMPVRPDIDPRILLFDQRIECQTCHRAGGSGKDLLVEFESKEALCLGCHQRAGTSDIALDQGTETVQIAASLR